MNLSKALSIASQAHDGQFDKSGQHYILHPLAVMNDVKHKEEDYKIVALLHDVVEDTDWTIVKLMEEGFNHKVTYSLALLTHQKDVSYEDYIKLIGTDIIATRVKLADLKHNSDITRLKGITDKDIERTKKYHKAFLYLTERYKILKELDKQSNYVINDENMKLEIISDIQERCNFTEEEAKLWTEEHGSKIVDSMWDEYSRYIEDNAPYKDNEDEKEYTIQNT